MLVNDFTFKSVPVLRDCGIFLEALKINNNVLALSFTSLYFPRGVTGSQICKITVYLLYQSNEMEVIVKTLQDCQNVWELDLGVFTWTYIHFGTPEEKGKN